MKEKRYCSECGAELSEDWSHDMCDECMDNLATMIIETDGIYPDRDDFVW